MGRAGRKPPSHCQGRRGSPAATRTSWRPCTSQGHRDPGCFQESQSPFIPGKAAAPHTSHRPQDITSPAAFPSRSPHQWPAKGLVQTNSDRAGTLMLRRGAQAATPWTSGLTERSLLEVKAPLCPRQRVSLRRSLCCPRVLRAVLSAP